MIGILRPRDAPPAGRFDSIQLLRAAAVMMVALYHATVLFPDPHAARWAVPAPLYFGYAGVDLFFVISGFIIMHVTRGGHVNVREFVLKRVFRILPLYWAVTTLLVGLWALQPRLVPIRAVEPWRFFFDSYLLLPTRARPLLGVGWTLQHEFQFYTIVAVLLLLGARRHVAAVLLVLFAIGVGLHVVADPTARWWDGKLFSLYTIEFAAGVAAFALNTRWRPVRPWPVIALGAAGFVATAALVTPLMNADREVAVATLGAYGLERTLGYGLSSFLIVVGALALEPRGDARAGTARRVALAIGDASFAIYLTHNLVLQALALATRRIPPGWLAATGAVLVAMVAVAIVGHVAHRLVEAPLIRFFERRVIAALLGHGPSRLTLAALKDDR